LANQRTVIIWFAHFHNIFVGLIVFAILGAIYYWFPKMSGRMLSERIGKWTFWLMTIGFNLTFMIPARARIGRHAAADVYVSRIYQAGLG
jgi:heme/copper-type cytochrome/quinol oxidase subunit 1